MSCAIVSQTWPNNARCIYFIWFRLLSVSREPAVIGCNTDAHSFSNFLWRISISDKSSNLQGRNRRKLGFSAAGMFFLPVGTPALEQRRFQDQFIGRNLVETEGNQLFVEIGIHEFSDIERRLPTKFFNRDRIYMAEDSVECILVYQTDLLQVNFMRKDIPQFDVVVFQRFISLVGSSLVPSVPSPIITDESLSNCNGSPES